MLKYFKRKPEKITEEMGVHEAWYDEAARMDMKHLPAFLKKLTTSYEHDYGTICHAVAAAAVGAAWAVERSPQGGITGFQGGAIMWQFIKNWDNIYKLGPARITRTEDMLYPQNAHKFNTITPSAWEWLKDEARKKVESADTAHPEVKAHWVSILLGKVPFGYTVEK